MQQINFMVNNISNNQLGYLLLRNINREYDKQDHNIDYMIFTNVFSRPPILPKCSIISMCEIYGQEGITIATSSDLALKLINTPGPKQKFLYLWDLEWKRGHNNQNYDVFSHIYRNPALKIICRSESHAKLLENSFNVDVYGIVDNCDLDQLKTVTCVGN